MFPFKHCATYRLPAIIILSALLSGLELSETRHWCPISANVAVMKPVCYHLVATLAGDVYRFRSFKPLPLGLLLEKENPANSFFSEAATRELQACLRARRFFPNLDLGPLCRLAAFHKNQIPRALTNLRDHMAVCNKILAIASTSYCCLTPQSPLVASALLLIDLPSSLTPIIVSSVPLLLARLNLPIVVY